MYEELLKYSSREEVDILRQAVGQQILEIQERSDEWGNYVESKFKDYIPINDFETLFTETTDDIKEQEKNLRAKTYELGEAVR